uniref:Uncharacterized protein n=1 Tax=Cannabis sativa TaxID=3483 RepID=A0A803QCB8_CANSA
MQTTIHRVNRLEFGTLASLVKGITTPKFSKFELNRDDAHHSPNESKLFPFLQNSRTLFGINTQGKKIHYLTSTSLKCGPIYKKNEPDKDYIQRFLEVATKTKTLTEDARVVALIIGIKEMSPLLSNFRLKAVYTMNDFLDRVDGFIKLKKVVTRAKGSKGGKKKLPDTEAPTIEAQALARGNAPLQPAPITSRLEIVIGGAPLSRNSRKALESGADIPPCSKIKLTLIVSIAPRQTPITATFIEVHVKSPLNVMLGRPTHYDL